MTAYRFRQTLKGNLEPHSTTSQQGTRRRINQTDIQKVRDAIDSLRGRLIDTSTRNRLVHVNRDRRRANVLNIVHERSNDIYDLLRNKERTMRFRASHSGGDDEEQESFGIVLAVDRMGDTSVYRDSWLQTQLGEQALEKRLLKLYRDARVAEEESGANFLFLALGFLRWYETKNSQVVREAPLVLLPVELSRSPQRAFFTIKARSDEVMTNRSLAERLKADFGLSLPDIDNSEDWTPGAYFDLVDNVISQRGWAIDRDGMQVGFFRFPKALMHLDLDEANWQPDTLIKHPLIQGLLNR